MLIFLCQINCIIGAQSGSLLCCMRAICFFNVILSFVVLLYVGSTVRLHASEDRSLPNFP